MKHLDVMRHKLNRGIKMNREEIEKRIFNEAMDVLKEVYFSYITVASNRSISQMIARASVKMDVEVINKPNNS